MAPLVAIVVVNWNGKEILRDCLKSLRTTDYPNYKVIVVDNGSTDGSASMVEKEFPEVNLICNEQNLGFVKANNIGMRHALKHNSAYVLLLNNDTIITRKDWLKRMVEVAQNPEVGIVGLKMLFPDGEVQRIILRTYTLYDLREFVFGGKKEEYTVPLGSRGSGDSKDFRASEYDGVYEVELVSGACMLIKREVVSKIGLLDEIFSPYFGEETDYCLRAGRAGFKVMFTGRSSIVHIGSSSFRKRYSSFSGFEDNEAFFLQRRASFVLLKRYFTTRSLIQRFLGCLITSFVTKKESSERLSIWNLRLRKDPLGKVLLTLKAFGSAMSS